jgi:hypothetical protein
MKVRDYVGWNMLTPEERTIVQMWMNIGLEIQGRGLREPDMYWVTLWPHHLDHFKTMMGKESFNWCFRLKP